MPNVHISEDQTWQLSPNEAATTWIVDQGVTLASTDDFAFKSDFAKTKFVVKGTVDHTSQFGSAVAFYKSGGGVTVAEGGKILSDTTGVYFEATGPRLVNRGVVEGQRGVVVGLDDGAIINLGDIIGGSFAAVTLQGADGNVLNAKGGLIKGSVGIDTSDDSRIENHGTLEGNDWAIDAGNGADHIINRGQIIGSVLLGDGQNIFDTRGGTVVGDVAGGDQEDLYLISDASVAIFEAMNNGYDMLKTTVSYVLDSNNSIEVLTAIGKKNVDLAASDIDNRLNGNKGDNALDGLGGADWLDGGKGDDILTSGLGGDHLVFKKGGANDVVTDFNPDEDILYVQNFYLDDGYQDLVDQMKQDGADLIIKFGKDSIVLEGVLKTDLEDMDVTFANT